MSTIETCGDCGCHFEYDATSLTGCQTQCPDCQNAEQITEVKADE